MTFYRSGFALIAVGCASQNGVEDRATECPTTSSPCPTGCAAIEARGVDVATTDARCRGQPQILGCFVRPPTDLNKDACVVNAEGEAFGVVPSEQSHLLEHGYEECSKEELEAWTQAPNCDD